MSSDKSLTLLSGITWQLNSHPFSYKLTVIFVLKQYEEKTFSSDTCKYLHV